MNHIIRQAKDEDIPQIIEVFRRVWEETYPNAEFGITIEDIKEQSHAFSLSKVSPGMFVAESEKKIVGVATGIKGDPHQLKAIYVTERSQGIGSDLLKAIRVYLGSGDVVLSVAVYNEAAIRFYERHGFVKTDTNVQSNAARLPGGKIIPEIEMLYKGAAADREKLQ